MTERADKAAERISDPGLKEIKDGLNEVLPYILADELPQGGVDLAYFHGRSAGDEGELIPFTAEQYRQGNIRTILIPGSDGQAWSKEPAQEVYERRKGKYAATPGKAEFARQFNEAGINLADTREGEKGDRVYYSGPAVRHTGEEVNSIIDFIVSNPDLDVESVALVAHPHQLPRAFALMVHAINNHEDEKVRSLKVYPAHPEETNWDDVVPGSQGQNFIPRREHGLVEVRGFHTGLTKYNNLASPQEVLKYIEERDGGLERMDDLKSEKENDPNYQADLEVMEKAVSNFKVN